MINETDDLYSDIECTETELMHYGTPRHSGRYPWGSGEDPYQHESYFMSEVNRLRKEKMSDTDIARSMNMSTQQFRDKITITNERRKVQDMERVAQLKDKGYKNTEIAKIMDISEGTVRNYLKPQNNPLGKKTATSTALKLKEVVDAKGMIDIGAGVERELGVSDVTLNAAASLLKADGYSVISNVKVPQSTNPGKYTTLKVLAPPGVTAKDVWRHTEDVGSYAEYDGFAKAAEEKHPEFERTKYGLYKPTSVDSSRIYIRYTDDDGHGGADKDGVIELRKGVEDISLGKSNYAQVRIAVDGTHFLKGVAMYSNDIPDGYDIIFNTNKHAGTPKDKVFKPLKDDPDNPFGAAIKSEEKGGQRFYIDKNGKEQLSPINIVNSEGDWLKWSKTLSSQFLSKQNKPLIESQLDITYQHKLDEFEDIMKISNPTIKQKYLESFANDCDASAVHLKADALPRQASHLILPLDISDKEVYAPNYKDGETVALIRYPHAGTFEIPVLTVNNKHSQGKELIGNAPDAIGIGSATAAQLSGADFDGDTVMVIPISRGGVGTKIKATEPLKGLKNFSTSQYEITDEKSPLYNVDAAHGFHKQDEMGKISNLITDMSLYGGAPEDELARAVRHSMVVIDAEKHHLDWRASYEENGIKELKIKYQGGPNAGAATLISKAKSPKNIPQQKVAYTDKEDPNVKNGINILTGEKVFKPTGESYHKPIYEYERDENGKIKLDPKTGKKIKTGKILGYEEKETERTTSVSKMAYALATGDARDLISPYNTQAEILYADYANKVYALANRARKEMMAIKPIEYNKSAKEVYAEEVASLDEKLDVALRNSPRERQAQIAANYIYKVKKADNPNMSGDEEKKIKSQALAEQRIRFGAKKVPVEVTDKEWEAIQAGAISTNKLKAILNNTDMDKLRDKAMPKDYKTTITTAKGQRIMSLAKLKYPQEQIAEILGLSVSAVNNYILEEKGIKKGDEVKP